MMTVGIDGIENEYVIHSKHLMLNLHYELLNQVLEGGN